MVTAPRARRCVLLLALSFSAGRVTLAPAVSATPTLPELSVEAQRIALQHQVSSFVRGLTRNPGHADASLVRWNVPICPFVAGLEPPANARFTDRVTAVIRAAGAPAAAPGCRPNLAIVVTSDPSQLLRGWYARDAHLFGHAGMLEVRHFMSQSPTRPVSVWHNIDAGPAQGRAPLAHRMSNQQSVPVTAQAEASHLAWNAVLSISSAFEIIDAPQVPHVDLDALADYVAMTALTNIDPRAELGSAPSILRLFTAGADGVPAGLSRWDTAFLQALYESDQSSRVQRSQIADRVLYEISH